MSSAGNKVTICSRVAVAINAQLQRKEVRVQNYRGEQWKEETSVFYGPSVRINGTGQPPNALSLGGRPQVTDGTALTFDVDEQFIDEWMVQNAELLAVKNKLIWKAKNADYAKGTARDADPKLISGFEPLTPATFDENGKPTNAGDPRLPRKTPMTSSGGPPSF